MSAKGARRLVAGAAAIVAIAVAASVALAAQSADPKSVSTDHGVATTITLTGTSDIGVAAFNVTAGPDHGGLDLPATGPMVCVANGGSFDCSADVLYTPDASYEGPDSFTYDVEDTDGTSTDATVSITVGSAPIAVGDPNGACAVDAASGWFTTLEDTPLTVPANATCGLLSNDSDADSGDSLTASLHTDGALGSAAVDADGGFSYTPTADANGDDSFTYDVSDGALSDAATVNVRVLAVNDVPSFTAGSDVTVDEDSGAYALGSGWASAISAGPGESGQAVDFQRTTDSNASLFTTEPVIAPDGTLAFTPAPDAHGSSTIGFKIHDDGGTANGGLNLSVEQTFTITINSVNDPPSFTPGANVTVNQDTPAYTAASWLTGISGGPGDESGQTVSLSFTADDNPTLFSVAPTVTGDGTLGFTPAAARSGTAHLTLQAQDDGGTATGGVDTSAGVGVTIRINANPNAVPDAVSVAENSHGTVLDLLANDTSLPDPPEALTITSVSNDGILGPLHGTLSIALDGSSVTYVPAASYAGTDTFRYSIADPSGATDFATVFVTIVKDTTPPTTTGPSQGIRANVVVSTSTMFCYEVWSGSDAGVGIASYVLDRRINTGPWITVLTSPTAISWYSSCTIGAHYQFRVHAIDRNGNVGAYSYGSVYTPTRYQESSTAVHYGGTWASFHNTSNSGGYTRYTSVAGRYVTFTGTFRDAAFVAPVSSGRGTASVYVNGVKVATITLRSSTTKYRQVVWAMHFGTRVVRTIKIVVVGPSRVDVDAFLSFN